MRSPQHAAERRNSAATATLPAYAHPYPQAPPAFQAIPDHPGARDVALAQEIAWQAYAAREKATRRILAALLVLIVLAGIPLAGFDIHFLTGW